MANLTGTERARYVQGMFSRIAGRYDLMNRVMTAGQDVRWRREVIRRAGLPPNGMLLDLGAGTGDLAREALRQHPGARALAADFTIEMMRVGRHREGRDIAAKERLAWTAADGQRLPFSDGVFDAVVSGFLLRNLSDLGRGIAEQFRVLKPGGRFVSLDTTPPPRNILAPLIRFHLHTVIPLLGRLLTGQSDAYTYLPDSTESFQEAEILAERLRSAGFEAVGFKRLMFKTIAIHWGHKPIGEGNNG
jgi:demethylmenaquinone methyltransferase/2-methoxy-6-polyprenyl-1,4-benzoquinol methylase